MPHQWKGYVWAVGLVLVTLVVFTSPASAITRYVGCEDSPPALTYPTIQKAVNAAELGEPDQTIKVCEGTYVESVSVTEDGLRIEAEDNVKVKCPKTHPLSGSGFDLFASFTEIKGFDISGCNSGISVEVGHDSNLLAKNSIHHNTTGISFNSSSGNNSVVENKIFENWLNGIFDFRPQADYFFSNEIYHNGRNGIEISTTKDSSNVDLRCVGADTCAVIVYNEITDNGVASGDVGVGNGVYLNHADTVDVKWNKLSENKRSGLYSNTSLGGLIAGNDANENGHDGVEFSSASTGNKARGNRMHGNKSFDAADADSNLWEDNSCTTLGGSATCGS